MQTSSLCGWDAPETRAFVFRYHSVLSVTQGIPEFENFFSFVFGALLSVKLFSKFLSWSYKNHKNNTLYGLIGFMIGSLPSLWPWKKNLKKTDSFFENLYIPNNYFNNSEFNQGLIFFSIGFFIVLCLEFYSKKNAIKK